LLYRTYHGSAMPAHHQAASIAAWSDEQHVRVNRQLYQQKITAVLEILQPVMPIVRPAGGFCLWAGTPCDDEVFVTGLYCEQQVTVLPGSYLAREVQGANPGAGYVRIALVQPLELCVEAAQRIRGFVQSCV
jgi:N-succinyldiaminopimelate aminotransferase